MQYPISQHIEKRATYLGFLIYVLLVFIFPFVLITVAKLGDHSLMHNYIVPYSEYKFILIIIAGFLTGVISNDYPFVNSIFVGVLGLLVWLVFSNISGPMIHAGFSFKMLVSQCLTRVSLCAAGGLSVTLYRYALTSSRD